MLEILQRVHDADAADLAVPPVLADADAEATAQRDGGLSEQTIARLLEKVGTCDDSFTHMTGLSLAICSHGELGRSWVNK